MQKHCAVHGLQVATMALGANLTIMVHPSAFVVHRPHNLTTIRNMWCSAINSRNTPAKAQAAAWLAGRAWKLCSLQVEFPLANSWSKGLRVSNIHLHSVFFQAMHPSQMPGPASYPGGTWGSWCTGKGRSCSPQQ